QMYGLDFAGGGLRVLERLPHVRGVAHPDEPARVRAVITSLRREIARRRGSFGDDSVDKPANDPTLLVLIDGLLPMTLFLEDLDGGEHHEAFLQAIGDGPTVGIHFVISTDQPQRIPMTISNTVGERLVLPLPNQDAYYAAGVSVPGGRHPVGRAISSSLQTEVQIAVATSDASQIETTYQIGYISDLAAILREQITEPVEPIRVLGNHVLPSMVMGSSLSEGVIPLGIDDVDLEPATVDFNRVPTLLIIGPDLSGRSNLLAWAGNALGASVGGDVDTVLISQRPSEEVHPNEWSKTYRHPMDAIEYLEQLAGRSPDRPPSSWTLIGLDDCDDLIESPIGGSVEERKDHGRYTEALDRIVRSARLNRYVVVATGQFTALLRSQGWARRMLQNEQAVILSPSSLASGHVDPRFNVRLPRRTDYKPMPGRGVLVRRSETSLIQTVHVE
ncbi:MAG: FtsK/SpoIIIE domain-containing protein, partial [Actinomycetia bacterium]|nr:FtsK/SpoIIIE domain-containing protein [Actinomycetes bacterium]